MGSRCAEVAMRELGPMVEVNTCRFMLPIWRKAITQEALILLCLAPRYNIVLVLQAKRHASSREICAARSGTLEFPAHL